MKLSGNTTRVVAKEIDLDCNFLAQEAALLKKDLKALDDELEDNDSSSEASERVWKRLQQSIKQMSKD